MLARAQPSKSLHNFISMYLAHARVYYRRRDGTPTREHLNCAAALNHLAGVAGEASVHQLTRHHLRALQQALIAADLSRGYINAVRSRVIRAAAWAVEQELAPPTTVAELRAAPPLPAHRSSAREPEPKCPADVNQVLATIPHLPKTLAALVRLLLLTGARVGELLALRNADLDVSAIDTWFAMPPWHKSQHLGKRRVLVFDRRCQQVLDPLTRPFCPNDPLFASPARPGRSYRRDSVYTAIRRAAKRAGVPAWSPHQVRHAVATLVRQRLSLEHAAALLGHARVSTTEIYAQIDARKAVTAQEVL